MNTMMHRERCFALAAFGCLVIYYAVGNLADEDLVEVNELVAFESFQDDSQVAPSPQPSSSPPSKVAEPANFTIRKQLLERGCRIGESKLKLMRLTASDDKLFEIHRLIHDLSTPINDVVKRLIYERRAPMERRAGFEGIIRSVKSKKVMYCSPPKCGTTNWQRGMQVLLDLEQQYFFPPFERKIPKPEDYVPLQLFDQPRNWPEFFATHKRPEWNRIWAGRDPYARVYSAWRDKSRSWQLENGTIDYEGAAKGTTWLWGQNFNSTDERNAWIRKQVYRENDAFRGVVPLIDRYQSGEKPYDKRFTWDAFTQYLADKRNYAEVDNNHHWRTSTYQCGPCTVKYNIITHMENAATDAAEVVDILKVSGLTHFGTFYQTHKESTSQWQSIPKQVLTGIYRHYWLDFVLLGYSVDDALRIISYGK